MVCENAEQEKLNFTSFLIIQRTSFQLSVLEVDLFHNVFFVKTVSKTILTEHNFQS